MMATKKTPQDAPVQPKATPQDATTLYRLTQEQSDVTKPCILVVNGQSWHTDLPEAVLKAILDPNIPDTYIEVRGVTRSGQGVNTVPPQVKHLFVHTSFIQEVWLFSDLSED